LNHIKRASAVEEALRSGTLLPSPAILASFREASAAHHQSKTWRRVMAWPHVMFPHVTFFVFGIAGTIWLARRWIPSTRMKRLTPMKGGGQKSGDYDPETHPPARRSLE